MRNIVSLIVILLFSVCAYAHPGKTDYRGGHKCWKNCSEWELRYGEYHLHDKDWKPIRLDKNGNPIKPIHLMPEPESPKQSLSIEPAEQTQVVATTEEKIGEVQKPDIKTVNEHNYNMTIYEESILPFNIILLLILVLLLLIALIFIRKKREKY